MTTKFIPLPRLKHSRIRLNPTICVSERNHSPCNYSLTVDGILFRCPYCDGILSSTNYEAVKRVTLGEYTVAAFFATCPHCGKAIYRVSDFDVMKNWENR